MKLPPEFSSKSFIVLGLRFWAMTHFEYGCGMCGIRYAVHFLHLVNTTLSQAAQARARVSVTHHLLTNAGLSARVCQFLTEVILWLGVWLAYRVRWTDRPG